jgi:hypothetical protein
MTKDEALKLALEFVENSEGGTADLEAHIKEALAQRTWVGLTSEERNKFLYLTVTKSAIDFAKACEAKLKEKNT